MSDNSNVEDCINEVHRLKSHQANLLERSNHMFRIVYREKLSLLN